MLNKLVADAIDRKVVRNSETVNEYTPNPTPEWEAAYQRLLKQL